MLRVDSIVQGRPTLIERDTAMFAKKAQKTRRIRVHKTELETAELRRVVGGATRGNSNNLGKGN